MSTSLSSARLQSFKTLSDPLTTYRLSGVTATQVTVWLCPVNVILIFLSNSDHTLIVLSSELEIKYFSFGVNTTEYSQWSCPSNVNSKVLFFMCQALIVLSLDPVYNIFSLPLIQRQYIGSL